MTCGKQRKRKSQRQVFQFKVNHFLPFFPICALNGEISKSRQCVLHAIPIRNLIWTHMMHMYVCAYVKQGATARQTAGMRLRNIQKVCKKCK